MTLSINLGSTQFNYPTAYFLLLITFILPTLRSYTPLPFSMYVDEATRIAPLSNPSASSAT